MYLLIKINIKYRYNKYFINVNFIDSITIYKKLFIFSFFFFYIKKSNNS